MVETAQEIKGDGGSKVLPGVPGWLSDNEGAFLAELAKGKKVLEIGSYCGRSTIWMARTAKMVVCLDTFIEWGYNTLPLLLQNVERYGCRRRVIYHKGRHEELVPKMKGRDFDLVFIDGDHSQESVTRDYENSLPALHPDGGVIAFHDYQPGANQCITVLVDKLIADGKAKFIGLTDSVIAVAPRIR